MKSYRNQTVFTFFRMIWNQTDVRWVPFRVRSVLSPVRGDFGKFATLEAIANGFFMLLEDVCQ